MSSASKFFQDNINRIPANDHVGQNLNKGLLALAQQLDTLQREQRHLQQLVEEVRRKVHGLS